jgi:hypothetical protein
LSRVLSLLRCSLRSPAGGTATKRYLRLGNISDRENTISSKRMRDPDAQRAGSFHARISACAAVASLHLRVVSMKEHKHWKQAMQFLEIKMAAGCLEFAPPCLLCRCCCCNRPVRAAVIFSASPHFTDASCTALYFPCYLQGSRHGAATRSVCALHASHSSACSWVLNS